MIEAFTIMNKKIDELLYSQYTDELLYHYTDSKKAFKVLKTNKLLFNRMNMTNDPLEYKEYFPTFSLTQEQIFGKEPDSILGRSDSESQFRKEYEKIINSEKKNHRVCCFCIDKSGSIHDDPFLKGYGRSRMWGQYANGHEGVCLVFIKQKLIETVKNFYSDENLYAEKVIYKNLLPGAFESLRHIPHYNGINPKQDAERYYQSNKKILFESLFYKFKDYQDENEFRIMIYNEQNIDIYFDITSTIQAIVIGDKVTNKEKSKLWPLCKEKNIDLYSIHWFESGPKILPAFREH